MKVALLIVVALAEDARQTIFLLDHTNIGREVGQGIVSEAVWSAYANLFCTNEEGPKFLERDHDFAEFEIAHGARDALTSAGVSASSFESADIVFVALWEFGFCMLLHEKRMFEWETQKGILASYPVQKCPELQALYAAVVRRSSPRQHRPRLAVLTDKLKHKKSVLPWQMRFNSIIVAVEERRWYTGCSTHLAVPYFVEDNKWNFQDEYDVKTIMVGFVGSIGTLYQMCDNCNWWFQPSLLRRALIEDITMGCERSRSRCEIHDLDHNISYRHNVTFLTQTNMAHVMRSSRFCLIPRGDSSSTKRFFCAIFSLCIPVVVADQFPYPFEDRIEYDDFVIKIPEWELAFRYTNVFDTLHAINDEWIAIAVSAMRQARIHLSFLSGRAVHNVVDHMAASPPHAATTTSTVDSTPGFSAVLLRNRRADSCPILKKPEFNYSSFAFNDW